MTTPGRMRMILREHVESVEGRYAPWVRGRLRTRRPDWVETRVRHAIESGEWRRF